MRSFIYSSFHQLRGEEEAEGLGEGGAGERKRQRGGREGRKEANRVKQRAACGLEGNGGMGLGLEEV